MSTHERDFGFQDTDVIVDPESDELAAFVLSTPTFLNADPAILKLGSRQFAKSLAKTLGIPKKNPTFDELSSLLEGATQADYSDAFGRPFTAESISPEAQNALLQVFTNRAYVRGVAEVRTSENPLFSSSVLYRRFIGQGPYLGGPFCITSIDHTPGLVLKI